MLFTKKECKNAKFNGKKNAGVYGHSLVIKSIITWCLKHYLVMIKNEYFRLQLPGNNNLNLFHFCAW